MHPEPTDQELEALILALPQATWHIRIVAEDILFSAHSYNDCILPLAYVGAVEEGMPGVYHDQFVGTGVMLPPEHSSDLVWWLTILLCRRQAGIPW